VRPLAGFSRCVFWPVLVQTVRSDGAAVFSRLRSLSQSDALCPHCATSSVRPPPVSSVARRLCASSSPTYQTEQHSAPVYMWHWNTHASNVGCARTWKQESIGGKKHVANFRETISANFWHEGIYGCSACQLSTKVLQKMENFLPQICTF